MRSVRIKGTPHLAIVWLWVMHNWLQRRCESRDKVRQVARPHQLLDAVARGVDQLADEIHGRPGLGQLRLEPALVLPEKWGARMYINKVSGK